MTPEDQAALQFRIAKIRETASATAGLAALLEDWLQGVLLNEKRAAK